MAKKRNNSTSNPSLKKHRGRTLHIVKYPSPFDDIDSATYYLTEYTSEEELERLRDSTRSQLSQIASCYMRPVHTLNVPVIINDGDANSMDLADKCVKLFETSDDPPINIRLIYHGKVTYLTIEPFTQNRILLVYSTMDPDKVLIRTRSAVVEIYDQDDFALRSGSPGPILTGKRKELSELDLLMRSTNGTFQFTPDEIRMLNIAIDAYQNAVQRDLLDPKIPEYSIGELESFKKVAILSLAAISMKGYLFEPVAARGVHVVDEDEFSWAHPITLQQINGVPQVKLSRDDFVYIREYMKEQGVNIGLQDSDPIPIDLINWLTEPKYGDIFNIKLYDDHKRSLQCYASIQINREEEKMRVTLDTRRFREGDRPQCEPVITADYIDIRNFTINNLARLQCKAPIGNPNKWPSTFDEWARDANPICKDSEACNDCVCDFITMMLMIQMNPKRFLIQRERRPIQFLGPAIPKPEKEYVVVHIVKRSYIRKDVDDSEKVETRTIEHRDYVVPSWERRGFWRRTKTGKKVYIPPTTCRRQLPLTTKPIHIHM